MGRQTIRRTNGRRDRQKGRWTGRKTDGWTDKRRTNERTQQIGPFGANVSKAMQQLIGWFMTTVNFMVSMIPPPVKKGVHHQ